MSDPNKDVHRMIIKSDGAATSCGKDIVAFYPPSGYAMSSDAANPNQFRVSIFKTLVTCKACKEKMKDGDGEVI